MRLCGRSAGPASDRLPDLSGFARTALRCDASCHRILTPRCRSWGPAAKVLRMQWCYRFSQPALGGHGGDRIR
ncbi:hypothetical protein GCM10009872_19100 [Actinopolymorpha rutila]